MTSIKELLARARELGIAGASKMNKGQLETAIADAEPAGPIEVRNEHGRTVTVERVEDTVTVRWLCGATRTFTTADLALALERFTSVGERGLWYEDDDSRRSRWAAVLRDGEFYGDDGVNGGAGHIPWEDFKAALQRSLA